MASEIKHLVEDFTKYFKAFNVFLERSTEHQCMRDFICGTLSDILTTVGAGKSTLNVMGVGCGSGEIDLEILRQLHAKHPDARLENEVVEPSSYMLNKYKDLVSKTPGLDHITFRWNQMTAIEFESQWKQRHTDKKLDFIHMIQMLYYVDDPEATVSFFRRLLHANGKLLIIMVSGDSSWNKLITSQFPLYENKDNRGLTSSGVKKFLDAKGVPYQSYILPSQMDITACFTAGDEKGELLLDFLTQKQDFSQSASPELKDRVLEFLKHPECSQEEDGRIIFNNTIEALVLSP